MSGHTPGPWAVGFSDGSGVDEGAYIVARDSTVVVRGGNPQGDLEFGVQLEPDARLIAAAPELLDVIQEILDYSGGANSALDDEYVVERARAVVAKAKGEQP